MVRSSWIGALGVVLACIAPGWGQVLQQERLVVVREEGKPPLQCRVLKCYTQKDGSRICKVQPVGGGEIMTIVEEAVASSPPAVATSPRPAAPAPMSPAPRLLSQPPSTPLAGVPVSTSERVMRPQPTPSSTLVSRTETEKPTLIGRLFGRASDSGKVQVTMTEVPTPVVKAGVEAPPFGADLRRSWGKADRSAPSPSNTISTVVVKPAEKTAEKPATVSRVVPPVARREQQDPLRQPEALTGGVVPTDESAPAPTSRVTAPSPSHGSRLRSLVTSRWEPRKSTTDTLAPTLEKATVTPAVIVEEKHTITTPKSVVVTRTEVLKSAPEKKTEVAPAIVVEEKMSVKSAPVAPVLDSNGERAGLFDLLRGKGSATASRQETAKATEVVKPVKEKKPVEVVKTTERTPKLPRLRTAKAPAAEVLPGFGPQPLLGGGSVDVAAGPKPESKPRGWFWSRKTTPNEELGRGPYPSLMAAGPNAFSVEIPQQPAGPIMVAGGYGYGGYGPAMGYAGMGSPQAMAMAGYGFVPMGYAPPSGYAPAAPAYPTMLAGYYPVPVPVPPPPPALPVPSGEPARVVVSDQSGATGGLICQLRDSLLPSEREVAADRLTRADWRAEPQVIEALVAAARADPAPAVRAACVRSLGKMNVNLVPVVNVVRSLKTDSDLRVRQEVEQTLATLAGE